MPTATLRASDDALLAAGSQSSLSSSSLKPQRGVFPVFLCGMLAFLELYCTQPMLPMLAHVFHASEASVSGTISASTFGVAISAALLALFGERLDRKKTIVASMVALAICTLLTATATSLPVLALWRMLQGLITPGVFILTIAYVTEEWPPLEVPRVMSYYVGGTVFGGFLGRISAGILAERLGWRPIFLVLGILGLFGAALAQRVLPPARPKERRIKSASPFTPVLANLQNPRLLATFGIGFCMLYTLISIFSYITFYLAAAPFHLSTAELSWLFTVYLCGLAATLAAGTVLARVGLRHGMVTAIGFCLGGLMLTLVPSLPVIGLGLAMASSGVFISQTCANSFLRDAAPAGSRVSAAGMYICSYYIGGTVGGILPAAAWRMAGWPGCVSLTSTLLITAGLLAFFGWKKRTAAPDPIPL
ncbi:MFS transporter [Silvibacterium dinghuense]|uniref:MFS transporter n=1 Tax=Silvibacterium dinghuense TaxID=1560006 RepID=A0A4Q1SFZ7_9BACT|nr:MFS transporter [Silvibacterium dinghuense]RXS96478.1 MFS transporter [Silvibacterium dinghuense]GGG91100.1 MFS transporter [Silvibacterium dinghuense]